MPKVSTVQFGSGVTPLIDRSAPSSDVSAASLQKGEIVRLCIPEPRILVIDDDFVTRQLAEEILSRSGFRVDTMASGRQAMEWLEIRCVAVVITDIFMPDVDGLEIVRLVRRNCPQAKVIAMSGGSQMLSQDYLPVAQRLGADLTLTKPFQTTDLLKAVKDLVRQAELTDAVA